MFFTYLAANSVYNFKLILIYTAVYCRYISYFHLDMH